MNSAMQAVVSVKAIAVYGDCPEYPAGQISMKTFVKWAAATRTDLQSYPALNDKMRVLEQCITPEAKTALWACTTLTTNGVPVDCPSDAVKNAANAANLKARSDFHIEWLTEIIAACSPNTSAHIVKEMEKVTGPLQGGSSSPTRSSRDKGTGINISNTTETRELASAL